MSFFIGTDVGGTFTDVWVADGVTRPRVFKSPTTQDVIGGVLAGVRLAAAAYDLSFEAFCSQISRFGHGTTIGLNSLLTGNTAKTAILTTQGFADTLEIGRMRRQVAGVSDSEITDFYIRDRFRPLVPRDRIFELVERIDAQGRIITPLDESHARARLREIAAMNCEAVAVCTLWANANPAHELAISRLLQEELPEVFVTLSHQIAPVVGEYGRMSTTAANAAMGPIAGRYLRDLEQALRDAGMKVPVLMMTNAGGVLPTNVLDTRPVHALFSGLAAGVIGSQLLGRQLGLQNILTSDIGGTSFDVGVIVGGAPATRRDITLAGADIRVPAVDVDSIGAGGGSIASVQFGSLTVGPQSAGANPGPVCYGRGGTLPTATDADLVLGLLDPDNFIGGQMKLDVEAARQAIDEKIARPLGMSVEEAAWGIREVLDSRMADLLRRMTVERGHDPREFVLFANGGAGPSHAWAMARDLGLKKFLVPAAATAQSAYGCAVSPLGMTRETGAYLRVAAGSSPSAGELQALCETLTSLGEEAAAELLAAGAADMPTVERSVAMRYRGQTQTIDVPVGPGVFDEHAFTSATQRFEQSYETLFGRGAGFARAGYEIMSARAVASGTLAPPTGGEQGAAIRQVGSRPVLFDFSDGWLETTIYATDFPPPDTRIEGPAIIEFPGQSVVIPQGAVATGDEFGALLQKS